MPSDVQSPISVRPIISFLINGEINQHVDANLSRVIYRQIVMPVAVSRTKPLQMNR